jgi:hypothetical protein
MNKLIIGKTGVFHWSCVQDVDKVSRRKFTGKFCGILVPLKGAVHQMVNRDHDKFFGKEAESNVMRSFRQNI